MAELPDPRTEDALRSLMRDVRYRNSFHPENASYRRVVAEGFRKLYPGLAKSDATGRLTTEVPATSAHHAVAASFMCVPMSARDRMAWFMSRVMIAPHPERGQLMHPR